MVAVAKAQQMFSSYNGGKYERELFWISFYVQVTTQEKLILLVHSLT